MISNKKFNRGIVGKPPKLRFHPGEFFIEKKSKQLFCCILAFRLIENPNIWYFVLEERKNLNDPTTILSELCEEIVPPVNWEERIQYKPFKTSIDVYQFLASTYSHGDQIMPDTQKLLNNFEKISSGEMKMDKIQ